MIAWLIIVILAIFLIGAHGIFAVAAQLILLVSSFVLILMGLHGIEWLWNKYGHYH